MSEFWNAYEQWKKDCFAELKAKGYSDAELANAEICESGQVVFHRDSLWDITENGYVTPWEDSCRFVA